MIPEATDEELVKTLRMLRDDAERLGFGALGEIYDLSLGVYALTAAFYEQGGFSKDDIIFIYLGDDFPCGDNGGPVR